MDEAALEHNIRRYQRLLPAGCEIMGVVKADAYGHGAKAVARSLEKWGIRHFATAALDEEDMAFYQQYRQMQYYREQNGR